MQTVFNRLNKILRNLPWQKAIAASFVGLLLLTTQVPTHIADANLDASTQNRLEEIREKGEQGRRPRTTGQFREKQEALEGQPGEVIEQMGKDTAEAAGDVAETYGQTIKDVTPGVESNELPKDD